MHNPLRGVVTSEHEDDGGYDGHQGRDIGTRDLNSLMLLVWVYGVGRPVYSAFRMQIKTLVRWSVKGNRRDTWARHKTGNGLLGANPDGEGQGYNHMMPVAGLKVGDWVEEGQLIGHLDLSGNQSAPHLHFETWSNWRDYRTAYSPKILFDKYGIDTMDDPTAPSLGFAGTPAATIQEEDMPLTTEDVQKVAAAVWEHNIGAADGGDLNAGTAVKYTRSDAGRTLECVTDLPADVWGHLVGTPDGAASRADTQLVWGRHSVRPVAGIAGRVAALEETLKQLATGQGVAIDYDRVQEAARAGAEAAISEGVELDATVEIKRKEN